MGADDADQEAAKDGVDADDAGEPGGGEDEQEGQADHGFGGAVLQASVAAQDPDEAGPDAKDQEQRPADDAEEGPEGGEAAAVVDEGDAQRQQDPADDVVADAGGEGGDADDVAEQLQLGQDAAEHGEGGDGEGGADKEAEDAEADGLGALVALKLLVQAPGDGVAEAEGQGHARERHADGGPPVVAEHAQIDLEAGQEEEDDEAEIGNVGQDGHAVGGEDVGLEAGDAHHDGRAEQDAADDLGDDTRLAEVAERVVQQAAEDDDDGRLHDEEQDRVAGVVQNGIDAVQDAALGCHAGRRRARRTGRGRRGRDGRQHRRHDGRGDGHCRHDGQEGEG